jgi:hypothetical protein
LVILHLTHPKGDVPMKHDERLKPIVSGTYQLSEDPRVQSLDVLTDKELMDKYGLDEETLYYARQFMED